MYSIIDLLLPDVAYAAGPLDSILLKVDNLIINPLITLLFALAVVYFLYGVFQFIISQQSDEKKSDGKAHMLWGIVGITIMIGVWTILGIVLNTLGINKSQIDPGNGIVNLPHSTP